MAILKNKPKGITHQMKVKQYFKESCSIKELIFLCLGLGLDPNPNPNPNPNQLIKILRLFK